MKVNIYRVADELTHGRYCDTVCIEIDGERYICDHFMSSEKVNKLSAKLKRQFSRLIKKENLLSKDF